MFIRKSSKGFTLIELVMVIVILGVLSAVAIPVYYNLSTQAKSAAEAGVVGGVRAGITTYFVGHSYAGATYRFPDTLDSAGNVAASVTVPLFTKVLAQGGITADWSKGSGSIYTGPNAGTYTYNSTDGSFK